MKYGLNIPFVVIIATLFIIPRSNGQSNVPVNHTTPIPPESNDWKIHQEIHQFWNPVDSSWSNSWRTSYEFDENGDTTQYQVDTWQTGVWQNGELQTYTRDESGNLLEILVSEWSSADWQAIRKYQYFYTSTALLDHSFWQDKSSPSSEWGDWIYELFKYDDRRELVERSWWAKVDTGWQEQYKYLWWYDSVGNTTCWRRQNWESGVLTDKIQVSYGYDGKSRITSNLYEWWIHDQWNATELLVYTYDEAGRVIEETINKMQDSAWISYSRKTSVYDSVGSMSVELSELWWSGAWHYNGRELLAYGNDGMLSERIVQRWIDDLWQNDERYSYEWSLATDVEASAPLPMRPELSPNYPNPFNPSTQITYTLLSASNVSLRIFNLLGEEVATLVNERMESGKHSTEWSGGGFPGGVYFYRLVAGEFIETKKMVLLK
jgi:hypothetical protein